jgi:hypothetical protein
MLFSKNGSYPKPETDGTEGWVEVPDAPEVPEGKELAWLNGEWVVRDPKPEDRPGYQWNWAHDGLAWVECEYAATAPEVPPELPPEPWEPTDPTTSGGGSA